MMSTPYSPENQQPYQPQQGGYPQQAGYQPGAYGQQPTQQMPVVGGYGQPLGYGQQGQQDFYGQGQFPGAPGDGAPEKKKTGLIIGIVAAVLVVLIGAGVAIWWFMSGDDSSDDAAAQSAPSTAAPSAGANPTPPPVGPNPSQPPVGTNPSQGSGSGHPSESEKEQNAIAECTKELNEKFTNASISDTNLELVTSYGETRSWDYTGTVSGTSTITKKPVNTHFTCSVYYFSSSKEYSAVAIPDTY
jgi:flagellar basal body-associated protein fliL